MRVFHRMAEPIVREGTCRGRFPDRIFAMECAASHPGDEAAGAARFFCPCRCGFDNVQARGVVAER
jgi:hypothetical protein